MTPQALFACVIFGLIGWVIIGLFVLGIVMVLR